MKKPKFIRSIDNAVASAGGRSNVVKYIFYGILIYFAFRILNMIIRKVSDMFDDGILPSSEKNDGGKTSKEIIAEKKEQKQNLEVNTSILRKDISYYEGIADKLHQYLFGVSGWLMKSTLESQYKNNILPTFIGLNYQELRQVSKSYGTRSTGLFTPSDTLEGYLRYRYSEDYPQYIRELKPMFERAGLVL